MKEYEPSESEFIDVKIMLRINLYRAGTDSETDINLETSKENNTE